MSKVRDLIEYYRLQSQVGDNYGEFRPEIEVLSGTEERFYYDNDRDDLGDPYPGQPYRMTIDRFTDLGVRYQRIRNTYTDDFVLILQEIEYDDGGKRKTLTYTIDANGRITDIDVGLIDINITWTDMPPSTGWPPSTDIADLQSAVTTLQGEMTATENATSTNAGDIATNAGDITTIQGSMDTTPVDVPANTGTANLDPSLGNTFYLSGIGANFSVSIGTMTDGQIINIFCPEHAFNVSWFVTTGTLVYRDAVLPTYSGGMAHIRVQYIAALGYVALDSVGLYSGI